MKNNLKGKRQKYLINIQKVDFQRCICGVPISANLLMLIFLNIIVLYICWFYGSLIIPSLTSLLKLEISLNIVIGAIFLFPAISITSIILLSFCYLLNRIYSYSNRYIILFSSLVGILKAFLDSNYELKVHINSLIIGLLILYISTGFIVKSSYNANSCWRWLRDFAIYCASIFGTSFYDMDLIGAKFDLADLRNTDLRAARLKHTSFVGAKNLELAITKGTILEDERIRNLLIAPQSGEKGDFKGADFTGAYLVGANLQGANLIGANLQDANLTEANLASANLKGVNAIDTDFTDAILHDICIQDWNVSKKTNFKNVQCRRVFLKQNQQEPKPDSGFFAEGEFEKWITDVSDTIDLILQNGLNLRSLAFALTQVSIDHEDTQLTVESLSHKGNGVVVVKIGVQQTQEALVSPTSKAIIHKAITQEYADAQQAIIAGYELLLRAKDEEIARGMVRFEALEANMRGLIGCLAQPKQLSSAIFNTYIAGGDIVEGAKNQVSGNMDNSDRSTNTNISTNIGGDINSADSVINLGTVEGSITNNVKQSQDLAEIISSLQNLQMVIQEDAHLNDLPRKRSLEEVKVLTDEAKKEPNERNVSKLSKAIGYLSSLGDLITDGSKLAQVCQTYLPTLSKFFGIGI